MKRGILRACAIIICIPVLLSGCAPLVDDADIPDDFTIYASFYPIYALSALIIDGIPGMTLNQLIQPQDGCLRSYQLSDWDMALALNADALILGGRGLESFGVNFQALGGEYPAVVSAMSALELASNGVNASEYAFYDESASHYAGDNPWLFLSVQGAMDICEAIAASMILLDAPYAAAYRENLASALSKLEALTNDMGECLRGVYLYTPVALMHEGLGYFASELGLNSVCQIERESGVMPSTQEFEAMLTALSDAGAKVLLIEKQAPAALTRALEDAGFIVCVIDTLSTGRAEMGADGYFSAMMQNARRLQMALSEVIYEAD